MTCLENYPGLAVTLAHAIYHLTVPLATSRASPYSSETIMAFEAALEANLAAFCADSWCPHEPFRGSDRRRLSFAPGQPPPSPVYAACRATGVDWSECMRCFDHCFFDLYVDPGYVSVRLGAAASLTTLWSSENEEQPSLQVKAIYFNNFKQRELEVQRRQLDLQAQRIRLESRKAPIIPMTTKPKTLAQRLAETESEDEEALFSLLAKETCRTSMELEPLMKHTAYFAPSQLSSVVHSQLPIVPAHSHSRSQSSMTGMTTSFDLSFSNNSTMSSRAYMSSGGSTSTRSRRECTRHTHAFADKSRTGVVRYDGGKTTVINGGVMIGAAGTRKPNVTSNSFILSFATREINALRLHDDTLQSPSPQSKFSFFFLINIRSILMCPCLDPLNV